MCFLLFHLDKTIFVYKASIPELSVSIIIPFRNEEDNICNCIDSVLNQRGLITKFEIIAVNDHSDDSSETKLMKYKNNDLVKVVSNANQGKKQALLTGISKAKYNIVLTLDADCVVGENWLSSMCNIFEKEACQMLCGPVSYQSNHSIFQDLQQSESAAIVGISFTLNNLKQPSTCNGANLMFDKNAFNQLGGYRHSNVVSGDDDLLMHDFFKSNLKVISTLNKECVVKTIPCLRFQEFKSQRMRWISKANHYQYSTNNKVQLLVMIQNIAFYIALALSIFQPIYLLIIALKWISDLMFGLVLIKQLKLKLYTILLMPFYQLYIPYILLSKSKEIKWKNRPINA